MDKNNRKRLEEITASINKEPENLHEHFQKVREEDMLWLIEKLIEAWDLLQTFLRTAHPLKSGMLNTLKKQSPDMLIKAIQVLSNKAFHDRISKSIIEREARKVWRIFKKFRNTEHKRALAIARETPTDLQRYGEAIGRRDMAAKIMKEMNYIVKGWHDNF